MAYPLPDIEMLTERAKLSDSLGDRTRDSMTRKQSSYRAYNLSRSKR